MMYGLGSTVEHTFNLSSALISSMNESFDRRSVFSDFSLIFLVLFSAYSFCSALFSVQTEKKKSEKSEKSEKVSSTYLNFFK